MGHRSAQASRPERDGDDSVHAILYIQNDSQSSIFHQFSRDSLDLYEPQVRFTVYMNMKDELAIALLIGTW